MKGTKDDSWSLWKMSINAVEKEEFTRATKKE